MLNRLLAAGAAAAILLSAGTALGQAKEQPNDTKAPAPREKATPKAALAFQDGAKKDEGKDAKKDEPKEKAGPSLKVGDPAPAIQVGPFVKGEPITAFQKNHVYVVEFWATWCGPCIRAIPHITELQKQYKDKNVHMLGVSVWESDQGKVEPFVKKMGDKMDYTVVFDDVPALPEDIEPGTRESQQFYSEKGKMSQAWMKAAGRNGIPTSFVIGKDSKIAWIGHPIDLDEVVADVVAGTFDPAKQAEREKKKAEEGRKAMGHMRDMQTAIREQDWDAALKAAEALDAMNNKNYRTSVDMARYQIHLGKGNTADAAAIGNKLFDANKDDAMMLNQVAWFMVDPEAGIKNKDLALAMKAAERANELTKGENAAILDTLARVHFEKGQIDKAIEVQTKAVEKADDRMAAELEATLKEYKSKQGK